MNWNTGEWSSYPEDGRAFLERDGQGWWVYNTDPEGRLAVISERPLMFAPPAHPEQFETVEEAQQWVLDNIPARSTA